jgi:bacillithiol system protein YtxJ
MGLFSSNTSNKFPWTSLEQIETLKQIQKDSEEKPVLIFKHSTRCSISSMALNRFEKSWDQSMNVNLLYLDLIAFRSISNEVASLLNILHESPQVIVLFQGKVIYSASHGMIKAEDIKSTINNI